MAACNYCESNCTIYCGKSDGCDCNASCGNCSCGIGSRCDCNEECASGVCSGGYCSSGASCPSAVCGGYNGYFTGYTSYRFYGSGCTGSCYWFGSCGYYYYEYCPNGCSGGVCQSDTTPPTGTLSVSPTTVTTGQTITITVTGYDNKDVGTLYANFGGVWNSYTCSGVQTSCSYTWYRSESTPGSYTYTGYIYDATGNGAYTSPSTVTVTVVSPCVCTSGACCDGCNYKSSGSQPTGYTDGYWCNGSVVTYADYYCNGTDASSHVTNTPVGNCDTSGTGAGRTGDGCLGTNYIDYYCSGTSCTYSSSCTESCCDAYYGNSAAYCSGGTCYAPPDTTPPTSSITSPVAGSWQTANFSVSATDSDTGGSGLATCYYHVYDSVAGWTKSWATRTCNSSFTVTVGSSADCRTQGSNTCTVYAFAQDGAGNTSSSDIRSFSTDTTPPTGTLSVSPTTVTTGQTITITVTGNDNVDVNQLQALYGGSWHTQFCDGIQTSCTRTWTTSESTAGSYSYCGNVYDSAFNGAWTTPNCVTVTVTAPDTTSPTGTLNVSPTTVTTGQTITITITGNDNVDVNQLQALYGGSWHTQSCDGTQTSCTRTWTTSESTAGSYSYCGYVYDTAGNGAWTIPNCITVTVVAPDTTPPVSTITSPAAGSLQTANFSVSATDSDTGGSGLATCYYHVYDSVAGWTKSWAARTCNFSFTVTVGSGKDCRTEGLNTCTVYAFAQDGAGNTGAYDARSFNIDLPGGMAVCPLTCRSSIYVPFCFWCQFGLLGLYERLGIIGNVVSDCSGGTDCTYCDHAGEKCNSDAFPSGSNGQSCTAIDSCFALVWGFCNNITKSGVWDLSESKCVTCDGKKENRNLGDTFNVYAGCDSENGIAGNGLCESACGVNPNDPNVIACDEKNPGDPCGTNKKCNDSCQCVTFCDCTSTTVGGCCDGCYYCPAGKVFDGTSCVDATSTIKCAAIVNNCAEGSCSGEKKYPECKADHSCDTTAATNYTSEIVYADTGSTLTSTCVTNGTTLCGHSSFNGCNGSCQKKNDQLRCDASHNCLYDVGDNLAGLSTAGNVCSAGSEVAPSSSINCDKTINCVDNTCSADRYYRGCTAGATSCTDTGRVSYSSWNVSSNYTIFETIYKVGDTCATNQDICGYSAYNKCGGVGSPYSCRKGRDPYRCNETGSCTYDTGDDWANVVAGNVCVNGAEVALSTNYYCGYSDSNLNQCQWKRTYSSCNGSNVCSGSTTSVDTTCGAGAATRNQASCAAVTTSNYCDYACDGLCRIGYRGCAGSGTTCEATFRAYNNCVAQTACFGGSCSSANLCDSAWRISTSGDNGYGAGGNYSCQGSCDGNNSCDYAVNCTAVYTLTVSKAGTGAGTVTSAPAGINCGATCTATYTTGTSVTLTATPTSGSYFAGWSGDCSGTGTCTLAMSANKTATATFNLITYTLSVAKAGTGTGTVTSSPAGINCGATCTATYTTGTSVTLTATPTSGSYFAGWSGDCSGTGTCTLAMSANKTATATFNLITYTLSVSKAGTGTGTVTSAPAGINCGATCTATYTTGTSVTLTATPISGSYFAGWSGDCSGTGTCTLTMSANKNATATYTITGPICNISVPTTGLVNQWIEINVSGSQGTIAGVRFASDNILNGIREGSWNPPPPNYYDWNASSGNWSVVTKTMKWSFASVGNYEVWAEVKDLAGLTRSCYDTILIFECYPGETKNCTSLQGCNHTLICQANGTWPSCPTDTCTANIADSPNCSCPGIDGCVGNDYYDFSQYGDCATTCACNIGTASGQPCAPTVYANDSRCVGQDQCNSDANCNDGNPCTNDWCERPADSNSICHRDNLAEGTNCGICKKCDGNGNCINRPDGYDSNECGAGCQRCIFGFCQDYHPACDSIGNNEASCKCMSDSCIDCSNYYDGGCGYQGICHCGLLEKPVWSCSGWQCACTCQYDASCEEGWQPGEYPEVIISPSPQEGNPGQELSYEVTIINPTAGGETYTISGSVPSDWSYQVSPQEVTIGAGQSTNISFKVTPPQNAPSGEYEIPVTAQNSYSGTGFAKYVIPNQRPYKPTPSAEYPGGVSWDHCSVRALSLPTFHWNYSDPEGDPQASYQIRLDNDSDFSSPELDEFTDSKDSSSHSYTPSSNPWGNWMNWNTNYWWIVKVKDKGSQNWSEWSDPTGFTTPLHAGPWPDFSLLKERVAQNEVVTAIDASKCYTSPGNTEVNCRDLVGTSYQWDFNYIEPTFTVDKTTKGNTNWVYSDLGAHKVKLRIEDNIAKCTSETKTLTVTLPLPKWKEIAPF